MGKRITDNEEQNKLFQESDIPESPPPGKRQVCTPSVKLKNGRVIYAASYGKKAFCFYVNA